MVSVAERPAKPAILIADHEPAMRLLVRITVDSERYVVLEAEDGPTALAIIRQAHPRLALLDVRMPGMNGLEVTRAVRADPALAGTRVVLLTARAQAADEVAGYAAGADVYLTKPFSPLELVAAVETALALDGPDDGSPTRAAGRSVLPPVMRPLALAVGKERRVR